MNVALVNLPFAWIGYPSLALGILQSKIHDEFPDASVKVFHANLDFVDWAAEKTGITVDDYSSCANSMYSEWIFSSALYGDPSWRTQEFVEHAGDKISKRLLDISIEIHRIAPVFISELAERIVEGGPDVVGLTSTFAQHTAALAAARLVKELLPGTATVIGGANCDGPPGAATHRNFPFIDFVVRGEGELPLAALLAALPAGDGLTHVPGLCWRTPGGESVANKMSATPLPPSALVTPSYDDYFERHRRSLAGTRVEPQLVMESSRGCWWGEKHHCTFCGLNGSLMKYRSVPPDRFVGQLLDLVEKYQILDVIVTDNILDMAYLSSALPRLKEADYDLNIFYEIKSNLRREQLEMLKDAGVTTVQPGVESLSGKVLKLMDKGVNGCQNVRLLRDTETVGLDISWNYLYGFPGESDEDYEKIIEQLPALYHLVPPTGALRISVQRFSPYFNRPELGFPNLRPAQLYPIAYDLPEAELNDLAYFFDAPPSGIDAELGGRLQNAIDRWRKNQPKSRLIWCDLIDEIVLVNTRPDFDWRVLQITDPGEITLFRLLDQPHTIVGLERRLADSTTPATTLAIIATINRWRELGLIFDDAGLIIQVAPRALRQDVLRTMKMHPVGLGSEVPMVPELA